MAEHTITVAIPAYNAERTILDTLNSANEQICKGKEVLILDDGSTDSTLDICKQFKGNNKHIRIIHNKSNLGIGKALERLLNEADGKYVIFLCSDDVFTNRYVCGDYVKAFEEKKEVAVIGRYYYEYMDGCEGAVGVFRVKNIITGSCNPSGMGFRRIDDYILGTNKIFVEMPSIVVQYLRLGYEWTMFEYDVIAVRIHPGGNTGTKKSYYKESMIQNWYDLVGKDFYFPQGLVQYRARASYKLFWRELCLTVKLNPRVLLRADFWLYASIAVVLPSCVLKQLSAFYRHRIGRMNAKVIERG